jgi:hypothetical protein
MENDPRNKLAIAHMVLYKLAHDQFIDRISMENALKEIADFIGFLTKSKSAPSISERIVELLIPGCRMIELHLNNETAMLAMIEVALWDFDKAIELIGEILKENNSYAG